MSCQHIIKTEVLTPGSIHHGKELCADCGAFLRWLKKPETLQREKDNAAKLAALKQANLVEWEKGFILSLEKQGRGFSPKQQAKLDEMFKRL